MYGKINFIKYTPDYPVVTGAMDRGHIIESQPICTYTGWGTNKGKMWLI